MKKISFILAFCVACLVSFNSLALKLDDIIKTDKNGKVEITNVDKIASSGGGLEKQVSKLVEKEIGKITKKIDGQINDLRSKADNEIGRVTKIVDEAEAEFNKIKNIKSKVGFYIRMASYATGGIGILMLVFIFFLWKIYRKVKAVVNLKFAFKDIKSFEKRISELEKKVKELKAKA